MSELLSTIRKNIGDTGEVLYHGEWVGIGELGAGLYNLSQGNKSLKNGIGPDAIPELVFEYWEALAVEGRAPIGFWHEIVEGLEFCVTDSQKS